MVLINGQIGESLGYQFQVTIPNGQAFTYSTKSEADDIADSIPGAVVKMRAVYATTWMDTL